MPDDLRSQSARAVAEQALVRVVHHYGQTPRFVLLGGLLPQMLCSAAPVPHAGTTDIDVQVDLEIASNSTNAKRLENALLAAGFTAGQHTWRWETRTEYGTRAIVKFELLADLDSQPANHEFTFDGCEALGAANVRGTGYAARDVREMTLSADVDGHQRTVTILGTGLAGFLMAKVYAAHARSKPRDWYDIAYVLIHNDDRRAGEVAVREKFGPVPQARTQLLQLRSNFADREAQGTRAYVEQTAVDEPDTDLAQVEADAMLFVAEFCNDLLQP